MDNDHKTWSESGYPTRADMHVEKIPQHRPPLVVSPYVNETTELRTEKKYAYAGGAALVGFILFYFVWGFGYFLERAKLQRITLIVIFICTAVVALALIFSP
jgi:hypothetical protein